MQTTLHTYKYDVSIPTERKAYEQLCEKLRATNGKCFRFTSLNRDESSLESGPITLETEHLFSNQWNSTTHRVFDWCETIVHNTCLKIGHYLTITDEMREIRRNTNVCGFCGHQESAAKGFVFCDRCLDSPYLKTEEIHLTRMLPVELHFPERAPLTEAESAHLLPEYVRRQTTGSDSRNAQRLVKLRAGIIAKRDKEITAANTEHDGMIWLMDHGFDPDNVIYYSHTNRFAFGWRAPVSDEVASALLDIISEFPFNYTIKSVSRTYEN